MKIVDFKLINMDFVMSEDGSYDISPFENTIKDYLTDKVSYGWVIEGSISSSITTHSKSVTMGGKKETIPILVKNLSVSLVQYRSTGGY